MADIKREENLEEIKKFVDREMKKKDKLSTEEMRKALIEANENIDFLKTLDDIEVSSGGKRVIFVDGKACLVYDGGIFYVEDSMDSRKSKKKLTRKQATELYVEYFFRYIMNPAIERKKMLDDIRKISVKTKGAKERKVTAKKRPVKKVEKTLEEDVNKSKPVTKKSVSRTEGYVR